LQCGLESPYRLVEITLIGESKRSGEMPKCMMTMIDRGMSGNEI